MYGNVTSDAIDESFPLTPVNHYAASKAAMETMVHTWFERLPILIARPLNYTGRGQASNFLVPKIVEHFARREPSIELGNLDVARDFSDVRYVARAYEALLTSDAAGETVNVCTGTPYTLREILSAASDMTGHKLQAHVNSRVRPPNGCEGPRRFARETAPAGSRGASHSVHGYAALDARGLKRPQLMDGRSPVLQMPPAAQ